MFFVLFRQLRHPLPKPKCNSAQCPRFFPFSRSPLCLTLRVLRSVYACMRAHVPHVRARLQLVAPAGGLAPLPVRGLAAPVGVTLGATVPFNVTAEASRRAFSCPVDGAVLALGCPFTGDAHVCDWAAHGGGSPYAGEYACPMVVPTCLWWDLAAPDGAGGGAFSVEGDCRAAANYTAAAVTCECSALSGAVALSANVTQARLTPLRTAAPTAGPSPLPTAEPTRAPTALPSGQPTPAPTPMSPAPSAAPSPLPLPAPSAAPSLAPLPAPSPLPTVCADVLPYCGRLREVGLDQDTPVDW